MNLTYGVEGLSAALLATQVKARMAALKGITRGGDKLKEALRDQVEAAGFGDKLAKTWQGKVYQNGGKNPAAFVYSKAPKIIDSYARGATIVATGGRRAMAIPTDDTPRQRGGKAMTPQQVEARFGRKLRFVPAKSAAGAAHSGSAIGYLLLDDVVRGDRSGRLRSATDRQRRLAGTGKAAPVRSLVMFLLVRQVKKPKLFDLQAVADSVAATVPQLIAEEWGDD